MRVVKFKCDYCDNVMDSSAYISMLPDGTTNSIKICRQKKSILYWGCNTHYCSAECLVLDVAQAVGLEDRIEVKDAEI